MTATTRCSERDARGAQCAGSYEDGYCNVCGMAEPRAGAAVPALAAAAPSGSVSTGMPATASVAGGVTGISSRSGSGRTGSGRSGTSRTRRGNLGAGLVEVPSVPYRDPGSVILKDPQVPERKRFCGKCGAPVGRSKDGRPGRAEGFCPRCAQPYSFVPKLRTGELVAGQYEIIGCIAHGGLGWIYLARDTHVANRWVVLKGLLDSGDADALAAAQAERKFLAEVEHPNIVKIHNFVDHDGAGYIVMEYVGGKSLKDVRKDSVDEQGHPAPLPVATAVAFILELLPAFGYLHSKGFIYCDFKPDNAIQTEEQIKLIDLGGVRQIDDEVSALYGTVGYQAPEVAELGVSVPSDLYTVARALAVLALQFPFQQPAYVSTLPRPAVNASRLSDAAWLAAQAAAVEAADRSYRAAHDRWEAQPGTASPEPAPPDPTEGIAGERLVLARYDAFHRFLVKGTHPDPGMRFQSAEDMADQLLGVLREVVALDGAPGRPAPSRLFTPELLADAEAPGWKALAVPTVDPADPASPLLSGLGAATNEQVIAALVAHRSAGGAAATEPSAELRYRLVQAHIAEGQYSTADQILHEAAAAAGADWRLNWWTGVRLLAEGHGGRAAPEFDAAYSELPGEQAPKLALACALEMAGDVGRAAGLYWTATLVDPYSATASFGLARCRLAVGDRAGAAAALRSVPAGSGAHPQAQMMLCRALSSELLGAGPQLADLVGASQTIDALRADAATRMALTRGLLESALKVLRSGTARPDGRVQLVGVTFDQKDVRRGLERACRELARYAATREEKLRLVDMANDYRGFSLL